MPPAYVAYTDRNYDCHLFLNVLKNIRDEDRRGVQVCACGKYINMENIPQFYIFIFIYLYFYISYF